jgi:hypothetical protein
MKKHRFALRVAIAAALAAPIATFTGLGAAPAYACSDAVAHPLVYTGCMAGATEDAAVADANQVLGLVPSPPGWHQRFLCAWNYQTNKQVCLFFPYPA